MQRTVTIVAFVLLLFNGIGAMYGGMHFIIHPDGSSMGMSRAYLKHSLFPNYLLPGIVLLVVNGLLSLVTATLTIVGFKHYPKAIFIQGVLLLGWLVIQIMILRFIFILHIFMAIVGLLLTVAGVFLYKTPKIS